jgi:hypothetical protein
VTLAQPSYASITPEIVARIREAVGEEALLSDLSTAMKAVKALLTSKSFLNWLHLLV